MCWETPPGGQFWYRFVRWRALPRPLAGKWAPEVTFRMDLCAGGASLGQLLGNGPQRSLFVWICTVAGPPWATCWEMGPRGHFSYRFVRWRGFPGPPAGKGPPEVSFGIDLYAGGASLGHLLGSGFWGPLLCYFVPRFARLCHHMPILAKLFYACHALPFFAVPCIALPSSATLCHAS